MGELVFKEDAGMIETFLSYPAVIQALLAGLFTWALTSAGAAVVHFTTRCRKTSSRDAAIVSQTEPLGMGHSSPSSNRSLFMDKELLILSSEGTRTSD